MAVEESAGEGDLDPVVAFAETAATHDEFGWVLLLARGSVEVVFGNEGPLVFASVRYRAELVVAVDLPGPVLPVRSASGCGGSPLAKPVTYNLTPNPGFGPRLATLGLRF